MTERNRALFLGSIACGVAVLSAATNPSEPMRLQSKEYVLKARMIQKMIPYVSWPERTFAKGKTVFTIGVLGKDPFGKTLDAAFLKARPKGCKVQVVRLGSWAELEDKKRLLQCHALFIGSSEKKQLTRILAPLRKAPVWIVSDAKDFGKLGVHINFFVAKSKIRFETNAAASRAAGLRMSSKLLRLGRAAK